MDDRNDFGKVPQEDLENGALNESTAQGYGTAQNDKAAGNENAAAKENTTKSNHDDSDRDEFSEGFKGFDSAVSADEEHNDSYTVTPNGGYYGNESTEQKPFGDDSSKQDATAQNSTNTQKQSGSEGYKPNFTMPQGRSYFPNGSYGGQPSGASGGFQGGFHSNGGANGGYGGYNGNVPPSYRPTKPKKAPKPPKKSGNGHSFGIGSLIAVALAAAVLTTGCFWGLTAVKEKNGGTATTTSGTVSSNNSTTEKVVNITGSIEQLAETAAEKASSSVVGIGTTYAVKSFFSGESTSSGSGSGVIYKSDGYIITNYHVIADALTAQNSSIVVYLDNDTKNGYKASVINYNISCDLAVLKIDKTGLSAIEIGDSDKLKIGQYVVAIGSPGGLEFMGSTTFGIVSGLNRQISTTNGSMNLIQTDAAINPGNSGGALVDTEGKLVGISSSKLVNESYEGMGFAIPVNKVVKICDDLIAHEGEGDPYTGISISSNYTSEVLKYYGYPSGAVVAGVDSGSPAETAGLKRGDIITKFGDTEISEPTDYDTALSNYYPKDTVKVTYYRSGQTKTVTLTIGSGK